MHASKLLGYQTHLRGRLRAAEQTRAGLFNGTDCRAQKAKIPPTAEAVSKLDRRPPACPVETHARS